MDYDRYLSNPIAVSVWTDTDKAYIAMNWANGPKILTLIIFIFNKQVLIIFVI